MLTNSVWLMIAYLVLGLLTCLIARRGWPQDWDETLLASTLGPPLFLLLAAAAAADYIRARLQTGLSYSRQQSVR